MNPSPSSDPSVGITAPVTLHAVGDVGIVGRLADGLTSRPSPFPFAHVASLWTSEDIVFGNLEIPLSGGATIVADESRRFETPGAGLERLAAAGFHLVSLANNHIMDFGEVGLSATRRALAAHGIASVGAGRDLSEARQPAIIERRGVRVGFLAYCVPCRATAEQSRPGAAPLALPLVKEDLAKIRRRVDYAAVSLHFGMMYLQHPTPEDMALAHAIADAGADVIIGHHPHVLQGIEQRGRTTIAYSLGEFIFDPQAGNYYARIGRELRRESVVFRVALGDGPPRLLPPIPTWSRDDLCPEPLDGARANEALEHLAGLSRALTDPASRDRFWRYAGGELLGYQLSGIWFEMRHGHWRRLLARMARIRPRHFKLVAGYVRSKLSARAA